MNLHRCGLLFVFSGPSGAGKNTVMKAVMERSPGLQQLATATTRPIRPDEKPGREHEFLTEAQFRQRILNKELIEWQIIHDKGIYGVPRTTIQEGIRSGKTLVADVDVLGAMQLKQEFGKFLVLVFINAPDKATLERRLRQRADFSGEEELHARLRRADFEIGFASQYDHQVINSDSQLEAAVDETLRIIQAECDSAPPPTENLGWDPHHIRQRVTALLIQGGKVLLRNNAFPRWDVPNDAHRLPFEVVCDAFRSTLDVDVLPTRHDAVHRKVDIGFEPPQLVQASTDGPTHIKDFIYVLQAPQPITDLPPFWGWTPIEALSLDETLSNVLQELALKQPAE